MSGFELFMCRPEHSGIRERGKDKKGMEKSVALRA
jgi:hypothetical protein